jgi:hypothetical protein
MSLIRSRNFAQGAAWGLVATVGLMLQGCAPQQAAAPAASGARIYAVDQQGAAHVCTVPKEPVLVDGRETPTALTVGNDGGWCALTVAHNGEPYGAGLLMVRPSHGTVLIHTVGDATRVDYTPDRGYVGPDSFTAQMIPGDASMRVAVTVAR